MKILCFLLAITASMATMTEKINQIEYVKQAQYTQLGDIVIISVKLEPVFLYSQRQKTLKSIKSVASQYVKASEILVSDDIDIWIRVQRINEKYDTNEARIIANEVRKRAG